MKLRTSGSSAIGIQPSTDLSQEWARLKLWPISWHAVQKIIRWTHAAGARSPGGAWETNDSVNSAVPCRCCVPMSSNMIPPRLEPDSCMAAKKTQIAHCGAFANLDQ